MSVVAPPPAPRTASPDLPKRVATALVMVPILLAGVFYLPPGGLYLFFGVVGVIGGWEWARLVGHTAPGPRALYAAMIGLLIAVAWYASRVRLPFGDPPARGDTLVCLIAIAFWLYAALRLVGGYPENFRRRPPTEVELLAMGALMLVPTVAALAGIKGTGPLGARRLVYFFVVVFAADIGAYFAGRRFGRRKLAPGVSPGKSVEGLLGGLLAASLWAVLGGVWLFGRARPLVLASLALLAVATAGLSVIGDLTESLFKRHAGVKDSGTILPGHGGMLDRIDSILAASPMFYVGLTLVGL